MMYVLVETDRFNEDLEKLKKSGDKVLLKKLGVLLKELKIHPYTGTGKPEPLKGNLKTQWSRRLSQKHRLTYQVDDNKIVVLLLSVYGHYGDK